MAIKLTVLFLWCGMSFANPVMAAEPSFVIGRVTEEIASGGVNDFCRLQSGRKHMAGDSIVVTRVHACQSKYGTLTEEFYEVVVDGDLAYVPRSSLFVPPEGIKTLNEVTPQQRDAFVAEAKGAAKTLEHIEIEDLFERIEKTRSKGLALLSYRVFDVSEYTKGTGFEFSVLNPTKKAIKYVAVTVVGLNAVNDPVRTSRGATTVTVRGVGPIAPDDAGSYSFDYVWHTDLVESVRIQSIKIDYMDGSTRVISNVRDISLTERQVNVLRRR